MDEPVQNEGEKITDEGKKEDFFHTAQLRMTEGLEAMSEDKKEAEADIDFAYVPGRQWDDTVKRNRTGRPTLEYNKLPSFIGRVKNAMRMNRYSVRVRPKDDKASKGVASFMSGKIRSIEHESDSEEYQDIAGQTQCAGGRGFLRVNIKYKSDHSFDRVLSIDGVPDAFSVIWDPNSKDPDLQDAEWIMILEEMHEDTFTREFPKATPIDLAIHTGENLHQWKDGKTITIADYFYRGEAKKKTLKKMLCKLTDGGEEIKDVLEDEEDKLLTDPNLLSAVPVLDSEGKEVTREVTRRPWMLAKINGIEVLGNITEWVKDCKYHPIVPIWGERMLIKNKWKTWGLVRFVKDPVRSRNYVKTASVERYSLEPKAPWVGGKNQLAGHKDDFARSRKQNVDVLVYNDDPEETTAQAPPQRNFPEPMSQAAMVIAQMDDQDMHDIIGIPRGATKVEPGVEAGVAIAQRRIEGDIATYVYPDEMAKGVKRLGRILVDYMPKIYDTARIERIRGLDNTESMVPINATEAMFPQEGQPGYSRSMTKEPGPMSEDGRQIYNVLNEGEYDVVVDVGPQFVTLREETLRSMEGFIAKYPPAFPLIADLIAKLQDIPEAEIFEKRLRHLVPPGIREPEEGEEPPPEQPPQAPDSKLIEVLGKQEIATREQDMKEFSAVIDGIKKLMEAEEIRAGIQLPQFMAIIDQMAAQYMGPPPEQQNLSAQPGPGPQLPVVANPNDPQFLSRMREA